MSYESIRLFVFFITLLLFISLEFFFSYRKRILKRKERWIGNIGLILLSTLSIRLLFPLGLIYFANKSLNLRFGLLHYIDLPLWFEVICSILMLDLLIYFQHVLTHKWDILWKLHRVHHTDIDLDATSALRFHPIEIILSYAYKILIVFIFGIRTEAIILFEIILSSMAIFNHSNIHLPKKLETFLRYIVVTPQMHIIHHSTKQSESDMNFGFNFSFWDRLFKTYIDNFSGDDQIGQTYYRDPKDHGFISILILPFKNPK